MPPALTGATCGNCMLCAWDPLRAAMTIASALWDRYPDSWKLDDMRGTLGSAATLDALRARTPVDDIVRSWNADVAAFTARRAPFLLY